MDSVGGTIVSRWLGTVPETADAREVNGYLTLGRAGLREGTSEGI